ncbi:MAG: LppP/LprE family lipoprotein [Rothia sp. (in: high G+C Gram-positive bacteria)]|nr:LppP/LprE family lipoprotein [Rothia sp. (in: high G+C Gram-positive bacteria)]
MRKPLIVISTAALAFLLAGCSDSKDDSASSQSPSVSASASQTSGENSSDSGQFTTLPAKIDPSGGTGQSCASGDVKSKVDQAAQELEKSSTGLDLDVQAADTSTYDPCKALSWVLVPVTGSETSGDAQPSRLFLFHQGEYLQSVAEEQDLYQPQVQEKNARKIGVTYTDQDQKEHAAEYAWDEGMGTIKNTGDLAPAGDAPASSTASPSS